MRYAAAVKAGTALLAGGLLVGTAVVGGGLATATTSVPEPTTISVAPAVQPVACTGELTVPVGTIEGEDFGSVPTERTRDLFGAAPTDGGAEVGDGMFGASIERIADGDIASTAAMTCARPSTTQWLVGGSTALGSSSRLVLANPTQANVEATVTLYGGAGELEDRRVLAIGAGQVEELLLEAVVTGIESPVVRVDATGGGVVAALQDSRLDGLQPAGTSWVTSTTELGTSLVVPSIGAGGLESSSVLRLMAPEGATVSLTLVDDDGVVSWSGVSAIVLEPGIVTTVEIPQTETGAVEIESDAPVAAAAEITVARDSEIGEEGSQAHDRTWVAAQAMPGVGGTTSELGVYAPGEDGVIVAYTPVATTLSLVGDDGEQFAEVETSARTVTTIPLDDVPAGTSLTLTGRAAWTVLIADEAGFVASMQPAATTVEDVQVDVVDAPYVP